MEQLNAILSKSEVAAHLKSNDDNEHYVLARTRDEVDISLTSCCTNYCDVHANLKLTLSVVQSEI